jgi:hypothetical protein
MENFEAWKAAIGRKRQISAQDRLRKKPVRSHSLLHFSCETVCGTGEGMDKYHNECKTLSKETTINYHSQKNCFVDSDFLSLVFPLQKACF